MKTRKIILEITPNEAFELAYALEYYISDIIGKERHIGILTMDDMEAERKILQHFVDEGYYIYIKTGSIKDYRNPVRDVDDWYKALVKKRKKELSTKVASK